MPRVTQEEDTPDPLKVESSKYETPSPGFGKLSRTLRLDTVYLLFQEIQGHSVVDEKKVAILGDMRSACFVSLLHILPTTASITLLVLNWKGYYIGAELQGPVG